MEAPGDTAIRPWLTPWPQIALLFFLEEVLQGSDPPASDGNARLREPCQTGDVGWGVCFSPQSPFVNCGRSATAGERRDNSGTAATIPREIA